jgi:hypothetical protein
MKYMRGAWDQTNVEDGELQPDMAVVTRAIRELALACVALALLVRGTLQTPH